jgi:cytochrome c-type biogenesis protein CcmF
MAILGVALYFHDFSIALVANSTSRDLPTLYRVTALWSNQAGSLLFWSWILSLYSTAVVNHGARDRELMPYVVSVIVGSGLFRFISFITAPLRW